MIRKKLSDIAKLINGYAFKSEKYVNSGVRIIRIANVQDGYISDEQPCFYPIDCLNYLGEAALNENDLLMSLTGNVGRVAIIDKEMLPAGLNQRVECIRPNENISKEYLYYFFQSEKFRLEAIKNSTGCAQLNMSTKWLSNYKIPFYNEDITNIINKTIRIIKKEIEIFNNQLLLLDELIKSRFIEMFGDENDEKWPSVRLEEIGECKNGMNFTYKNSGFKINCLGVGDFNNNSIISDTTKLPYIELEQKPNEDYLLKNEDIVFVRSNGNKLLVGRSVLVYPDNVPTVFSGFCIRFRMKSNNINSVYLLYALRTDHIRTKMHGRGANIQNLNQKILLNLNIQLPPKFQQDKFASFVEQIDKLKFVVQKRMDLYKELLDKKMDEYFN